LPCYIWAQIEETGESHVRGALDSWGKVREEISTYIQQDNLFSIPSRALVLARGHMVERPVQHTYGFIGEDGNCLFRAFSHWKYGSQEEHQRIREEVIEYAKLDRLFVSEYLGDEAEVDKWINSMARLEVWGDSLAMELLAKRYKVILFVVSQNKFGGSTIREYLPHERLHYCRTDVYFLFHNLKHFEILDPYGQ
jgi:hypothetical protein